MAMLNEFDFQVGDKVVCINNINAPKSLTIGKIYRIVLIDKTSDTLGIYNQCGVMQFWAKYRFHKVDSTHYLDDEWQC